MIEKLLEEVRRERSRLKYNTPINGALALRELSKCIDHSFCYISYVLPETHPDYEDHFSTHKILVAGWYDCLNEFLDNYNGSELEFTRRASRLEIDWANDTLIKAGWAAITQRHIELYRSKIFTIKKSGNEFTFKCNLANSWNEVLDTENSKWLTNYKIANHRNVEVLGEISPIIQNELQKHLELIEAFPPQYQRLDTIDKYYSLLAESLCYGMIGADTVPEDSLFNGIKFSNFKTVIQVLASLALKHINLSSQYFDSKAYKNLNPWDYYLLPYKDEALLSYISEQSCLNLDVVNTILQLLTINKRTIKAHLGITSASLPPLIKFNNKWTLISMAGCLGNPFTYLLRCLKFECEKDFFKAVGKREEVFRNELYSYFNPEHFNVCLANVKLKEGGKLLTDIDGLIYSKEEKALLMVQLKWMDDYGTSMKQRDSMKNNLYGTSITWIDQLEKWLSKNEAASLTERIDPKRKRCEVIEIYQLVIARHIAHFSDQKKDARATWCSWPQFVRTMENFQNGKFTLQNLLQKIHEQSPEHVVKQLDNPRTTTKYKLGQYSICLKY